jgi:UDP-galactopyranose mutase
VVRERVYSLPINLHTINQFFGTAMSPDQARVFVEQRRVKEITKPCTFEEQALSMVGREIYEAFFSATPESNGASTPRDCRHQS